MGYIYTPEKSEGTRQSREVTQFSQYKTTLTDTIAQQRNKHQGDGCICVVVDTHIHENDLNAATEFRSIGF